MKKRVLSYVIIFTIYAIAFVVGLMLYNIIPLHYALKLLIADVAATIVIYIFSMLFKNASIYDPYWSVQPILIIGTFAITSPISISSLLALIAVMLWGIRLTLNWAYTFTSLKHQDWRYVMLKEKTGILYPVVNLLGIHLFPTLVVYMCILPIVFMINSSSSLNALTIIGFIMAILSVVLQGISDYQMHKFRKLKTGKLIRYGLWKYSRHPNYLAEIIMWWAIAILCISAISNNYWLFVGALINMLMFIFISIPMDEKRQAKSKEGFEEYKRATRMLLPIYKKVK